VIRLALLVVAVAAVGCDVPEVDYIVADAAFPSVDLRQGIDGYAGTVDTYIDSMSPNVPQGSSDNLLWSTSFNAHALLRFENLTDHIPQGSTVRDALLYIYVVTPGSPSGMLYEVTSNWDESTTYNTFGATPGVSIEDRTAVQIGTINGETTGIVSFHVGASLQRWTQNPSLNKGWVFIPNDSASVRIGSSERAIEEQRPGLRVTLSH